MMRRLSCPRSRRSFSRFDDRLHSQRMWAENTDRGFRPLLELAGSRRRRQLLGGTRETIFCSGDWSGLAVRSLMVAAEDRSRQNDSSSVAEMIFSLDQGAGSGPRHRRRSIRGRLENSFGAALVTAPATAKAKAEMVCARQTSAVFTPCHGGCRADQTTRSSPESTQQG